MTSFEVFEPTRDGIKGYDVRGRLMPVVLDPESYMPKRTLRLEVDVPFNSHGGREMQEDMICLCESDLADKIVSELRPQILQYIKSINPYLRKETV